MEEDVDRLLGVSGCKCETKLLLSSLEQEAYQIVVTRAIHRGDYQDVLLKSAKEAGAKLILSAEVTAITRAASETSQGEQEIVVLKDGRRFAADLVVGADGLWSMCREYVLGQLAPPKETGHLAFRGTFSREQLLSFRNSNVDQLMKASNIQNWLGADQHAVFYPLRDHTEYNLVLICSDDLPEGVKTAKGSLEEMRAQFEGWDPVLTTIISCLSAALKWKLLHFKELKTWCRGVVALLGDASHPTLPHQGQGAAMAVEDGAVIGLLLDRLQQTLTNSSPREKRSRICDVLKLYEDLRKKRTEVNVAGAELTREFYHLFDGDEQKARDAELAELQKSDWTRASKWNWADAEYQKSLLGFDVLADAESKFEQWWAGKARL
jgi:salicylate hydroxylase